LESLGQDFVAFRKQLLAEKGQDHGRTVTGVSEMRVKIAAAKAPSGPWDAKIGAGRLQDIEMFSQMGALVGGVSSLRVQAGVKGLVRAGLIDKAQSESLMRAYRLFWALNLTTRFLSDTPFDAATAGEGPTELVLRETEAKDLASLQAELQSCAATAAKVIEANLKGADDEG
jgi:glutamate-ammonia-ligase adenylyltransferase